MVHCSQPYETAEYVPAGHFVHFVSPSDLVTLPAGQVLHVDPAVAEKVPAEHFLQDVALSGDSDPAGHFKHDNDPC